MTINANWLNIDPIEEDADDKLVIQPSIPVLAGPAKKKFGETIWYGSKPAPEFSLNPDLSKE